jgi:hypothetical protein
MDIKSNVYGIKSDNIEDSARLLEESFGRVLIPRYSTYYGSYYKHSHPDDPENNLRLRLQNNYIEEEEEWQEPNFIDYPLILYVVGTESELSAIENLILTKDILNLTLLSKR